MKLRPSKRQVIAGVAGVVILLGPLPATREQRSTTAVVVAAKDLSRGAAIGAKDVTVIHKSDAGKGALSDPKKIVGQILLVSADKGTILRTRDMAAAKDTKGRVPITVAATASANGPGVGQRATVVVSPRPPGSPGLILAGVPVLAVTKQAGAVQFTLAVLPGDLKRLAGLLGFSDIRISRPY